MQTCRFVELVRISFKTLLLLAACAFLGLRAEAQVRPEPAQLRVEFPRARPLPEGPDTLNVIVIGDVMMHSKQLLHDHRTFLREITPALKAADFAVANMEFPLAGAPYSGYPVFSTPDWYAEYVALCGVDVFLLANNHVLDKGDEGFERTLRVYDAMASSHGTAYTGAGADKASFEERNPLILEAKGMKIALVNFCYGSNIGPLKEWPRMARMRRDEVAGQFRRARQKGADFIVALPHWGEEYELIHNGSQEDWARWLVSEGADAVIGSHTHVVQDTMQIGRVPVVYSLGNAVSNMSIRNTRLELAATLRFTAPFGSRPARLTGVQLRWMWCTLPGKLTNSYATIFVDEWLGRRDAWLDPTDYDNMIETLERVSKKTGIPYERNH